MALSDVKFMNSLYNAANEEVLPKVNILFFTIISLIVALLIWSNIAKIDELTSGEGKVIPSNRIQTVQYLDGGIIADILIKEGEHVEKGQSLLKIDTTRFQATFEETQETLLSLEAKKVRLTKELDIDYNEKIPKLSFSKELKIQAPQYISSEKKIFKNKFYERKNNLKIVSLQHKQKLQELIELKAKENQLKRYFRVNQRTI